jgi:DNA processing protein
MQGFKESQEIHILRALALVIAEQSLAVRDKLLPQICYQPDSAFNLCQQLLPRLEWNTLVQAKLALVKEQGCQLVSIFEDSYPLSLKQISDPAPALFLSGLPIQQLQGLECVAIVGSRRADYLGLDLAQKLSKSISNAGLVVVSGLALGIDGAAHKGALASNSTCSTVAVLGSGLDVVYPPAHKSVCDQIVLGRGIVLSQFQPKTVPYPANFLNRNRLVAGLAKTVIVIQASLKSGSLVTARHAIDQGKDVLVFPGDIENPRYRGSNKLIQNGAVLVTSIEDVHEFLNLKDKSCLATKSVNESNCTPLQKKILHILRREGELRVDAMVRLLDGVQLEKDLLELELSEQIQRLPGNILKGLK